MRKFLAATILMAAALACGPQQPLDSSDPQLDASDEIGEQANYARKHMSDRGISSEQIGDKLATADDKAGEQANYARKHLSDRGVSGEQIEDLGVMTAEDIREYLYDRGICEMRHGDNCGEGPQEPVVIAGAPGKDGSNGVDGKDGKDGVNGADGANGADGEQGPAGPQGEKGDKGDKGDTGDVGPQGPQGEVGATGPQGLPGVDGEDAIIEVIDPCGDKPGHVDEVLFRLSNGDIAAWYEDVGLVILEKNVKYKTTDEQECKFKINNAGAVVGW